MSGFIQEDHYTMTRDERYKLSLVLLLAFGLCLSCLSWWFGHGTPEPAWRDVPDGGVLQSDSSSISD